VFLLNQTDLSDNIPTLELTPIGDDINTLASYQLLLENLGEDLTHIKCSKNKTSTIKVSNLKKYINDFEKTFKTKLLCTRSNLIRELYLLHQTANTLEKFNNEILQLSYIEFRKYIYFPTILYLLIRFQPIAKKFIQQNNNSIYQEFENKSRGLINIHKNSLYMDEDVIKSDMLYDFVGNVLKKYNPLDIGNVKSFYKICFRNIYTYYFHRRRNLDTKKISEFSFDIEDFFQNNNVSSRVSIYKSVLFDDHIRKTQNKHPILQQVSYNFQIFRNIIINNEFQNIYQNTKQTEISFVNNEFQIIDFIDDDLFLKNIETFNKLRELPLIYKLLRCVHIQNSSCIPYNDFLIKPADVIFVIKEELMNPFKNFFIDTFVDDILDKIANNFVKNVLSGEYINLITFSTVKINQISFIDQLRKFVRICLEQ